MMIILKKEDIIIKYNILIFYFLFNFNIEFIGFICFHNDKKKSINIFLFFQEYNLRNIIKYF